MSLSERANYRRNATFQGPQWIPTGFHISDASWDQLRQDLEGVLALHPTLFPDFVPGRRDYGHFEFGPGQTAGSDYTDAWGCVWRAGINGLEGVVVGSPLADLGALPTYQVPDPALQWDREPANWQKARRDVEEARAHGRVARGAVPHGFLFLRLSYLRGFENLMLDMASGAGSWIALSSWSRATTVDWSSTGSSWAWT